MQNSKEGKVVEVIQNEYNIRNKIWDTSYFTIFALKRQADVFIQTIFTVLLQVKNL